jgi:hypothetical protein
LARASAKEQLRDGSKLKAIMSQWMSRSLKCQPIKLILKFLHLLPERCKRLLSELIRQFQSVPNLRSSQMVLHLLQRLRQLLPLLLLPLQRPPHQ